ncbi:hypothetical protein [Qipengyuania sediminis]|uniref:hypothetical protein n=1 Tax=Qipengyuania sediminis TaxID=1532023 RepID=UPI001404B6F2|nr:hypothetical protein [Qipengyuania sediminis]
MEYEIGDDPQGLPDRPEAERDGGLRLQPVFFRKRATGQPDPRENAARVEQMGELA